MSNFVAFMMVAFYFYIVNFDIYFVYFVMLFFLFFSLFSSFKLGNWIKN